MMIFPVATIKVIHSHEVMWLKCIGKFIGDFKIPVGANFIGVIIIQFPRSNLLNYSYYGYSDFVLSD